MSTCRMERGAFTGVVARARYRVSAVYATRPTTVSVMKSR
jgi:hypothetical protein